MTAPALQNISPSPSPRAFPGGGQPNGGEGPFFAKGYVDWELLPFLKALGLTAEERAATQVALTMAEYNTDMDAHLVEWNAEKISKRSATSPKVSQRAKKKLIQADLASRFQKERKGQHSAVLDITNLIRAKGKKHV